MTVVDISKRAEHGLRYRLKKLALERCAEKIEAYVACSQNRTITLIWECRPPLNALNACLQKYTNDGVYEELKRRWIESGQSRTPNWDQLLHDLT